MPCGRHQRVGVLEWILLGVVARYWDAKLSTCVWIQKDQTPRDACGRLCTRKDSILGCISEKTRDCALHIHISRDNTKTRLHSFGEVAWRYHMNAQKQPNVQMHRTRPSPTAPSGESSAAALALSNDTCSRSTMGSTNLEGIHTRVSMWLAAHDPVLRLLLVSPKHVNHQNM